jgi:hypothetical protein
MNAKSNGVHHRLTDFLAKMDSIPPHLEEAYNWHWMTPTEADRQVLSAALTPPLPGSHWQAWNVSSRTRGDKVIIIIPKYGPLREAGIEAANEAWKTAKRVVVWELDPLGLTECPDLAAYAKEISLSEEIEFKCPWKLMDYPRPAEADVELPFESATFDWPKPSPLDTQLSPVPALEPDMLPAVFRPWLVDIAERGCVPLEFGSACAIVMLAGITGRRVGIRPKREDDWLVVPKLWGAIVAHSGMQKSPPCREAMYPVRRIAAKMNADHQKALEAWEAARMVASVEQAIAKAQIKKKAAEGWRKKDDLRKIALQANAENAVPAPVERRLLVNDVTLAKLGEILLDNPQGVIIFRDELIGFLKSMEMQGHESDRAFHLEAWNGNGEYTFDRIGRGKVDIKHCCESIFGTIQPGPLAKYLRGSFRGEDADGFLPRFQILLYPDTIQGFVNRDRQPDHASREAAFKVFSAISSFNPKTRGCLLDTREGTHYLHFSDDAQACFNSWRETLENRLRGGSTSHLFRSHLAKYRSLFPSLALLFHLVEKVGGKGHIGPVSLEATKLASRWCELLEAHARRLYIAAQDGDPEGPTNLADRITGTLPNPFTLRDIQRKGWSGLTSIEEVRRAVGILEDRGWVHAANVTHGEKGGRPVEVFWVNPALSVQGTQVSQKA